MNRREFVTASLGAGTTSALSGCCSQIRSGQVESCRPARGDSLTPQAVVSKTTGTGLIVDVHAHIFNAHDVPLEEYFTRPVLHLPPPIATLVQALIRISGFTRFLRGLAPCASEEYRTLCELTRQAYPDALVDTESRIRSEMAIDDESFAVRILPYVNGDVFRTVYRRQQNAERQNQLADPVAEDAPLTEDEILVYLGSGDTALGLSSRISGIWRFLRRLAAPRYQNAFAIMDLYGSNVTAPVDIFVAATVDFDVSLSAGHKSTPMKSQVLLMDRISRLTAGRVLPMVGYDPRRDEQTDGAALEEVRQAVHDFSHLGVKLYPPMGFAPYGNAELDGANLCEWPDVADYGKRLDKRLDELYRFAQEADVPILAHSSESNGITRQCQVNGSPENWDAAFARHPSLRVCAGHFGGLGESGGAISERMRGFVASITDRPESLFFVDLAFLPALFYADHDLGRAFAALLRQPAGDGQVADHVLFGTDWFMIAQDRSEASYVGDAAAYLKDIGGEALRDRVMSENPSRFLNLRGYLKRLESVTDPLALSDIELPHWAVKLPD